MARKPMQLTLRISIVILSLCLPLLSHAKSESLFNNNFDIAVSVAAVPVSKQQAVGIAKQYVPGRLLKVTLKKGVYRVKIISNSSDVVIVLVDGQTGERLKN